MNEGNKYLIVIRKLVLEFLEDEPVKIALYGSRARGDNSSVSDVDVGLVPKG